MEEVGGWEYRKVVESEGEFGRVIGTEGRIYIKIEMKLNPFFCTSNAHCCRYATQKI